MQGLAATTRSHSSSPSFFYSFYVRQVAACFTWMAWKKNEYFTEHNCHLWHANEQGGCAFRQDKWGVADSTLNWWADTPCFFLWFVTYSSITSQVPHVLHARQKLVAGLTCWNKQPCTLTCMSLSPCHSPEWHAEGFQHDLAVVRRQRYKTTYITQNLMYICSGNICVCVWPLV